MRVEVLNGKKNFTVMFSKIYFFGSTKNTPLIFILFYQLLVNFNHSNKYSLNFKYLYLTFQIYGKGKYCNRKDGQRSLNNRD